MNLKRSAVKIFALLLLFLFVMPILLVNGNQSIELNEKLEYPSKEVCRETRSVTRDVGQNFQNMTTFSDGTFDHTELDVAGDLGLTWELPKNPYEDDGNTFMLNHFENSLIGNDDEETTSYIRSSYRLEGLWKFDEGSGSIAYDTSGNNRHGTISGASWTTGKLDKGLRFDGSNDFISTPFNPVENAPFTFEAWINKDTIAPSSWMIAGSAAVSFDGFWFEINGDNTRSWHEGGSLNLYGNANLKANIWFYITYIYDGTEIIHYVNGNRIISSTFSPTTNYGNNLYIGAIGAQSTTSWIFDGVIDEVAFYSRAKSPEEIYSDYENRLANDISFTNGKFSKGIDIDENTTLGYPVGVLPEDNCIGLWRFNEGSGTSTNDISGNNNDGTLTNDPQWVVGKEGKALQFDGTNDYVDCGNAKSLDLTGRSITMEAWVNHQFTPGVHTYANIFRKTWASGSWLRFEANSEWISFNLYGVGLCKGSTTLKPDTWYHVVGTYDGVNMKIYLNGKLNAIVGRTGSITSSVSDKLFIGASNSGGGEPWKGKIDEFAIYNRSKTADEIYHDYLAGGQNNFNKRQGTLEFWIKPDWDGNDGINHTLFFSGQTWDNDSFFIYKSHTNKLIFITSDNSSNSSNDPSVNINGWKNNTWHHIAFTWSPSGTKEIYIDGILRDSKNNNIMPNKTHSKIYIGTNPDHNFYGINSTIDELRISSSIRTTDEFRIYNDRGIYESGTIDAGEKVDWEIIHWGSTIKPETYLTLQTKTSDDNTTWTNWTGNKPGMVGELLYSDSTGESINGHHSRFIKWRAILNSKDGMFSPNLDYVNITWNHLPKVFNISLTPLMPTVLDNLVISYNYSDTDNDTEGATKLEWYVDHGEGFIFSGINAQILDHNRTQLGENWYCRVTPHDGKTFGEPVNTPTVLIKPGPIVRIQLTPSNVTITTADNVKFSAMAYDGADNHIATTFAWSITSGGNIDQTGNFVPEQTGTHGVSATAAGISGFAVVVVQPGQINKVNIFPTNPMITADETVQFEAKVIDAKENQIHDLESNWSVDGGGVITMTGLFEPTKVGSWNVTVNVSGVFAATKVTVFPGKPDKIQLLTNNPIITTDDQQQFVVTAEDSDGNTVPIQANWDVGSGEITQDGLFIPGEAGTWDVTVTIPGTGLFAMTKITVLRGKAHELIVEPKLHILKVNGTVKFTVTAFDGRGNNWTPTNNLTWSISDESKGFILVDGTFTAKKEGKITVTATYVNPVISNGNGSDNNTRSRADDIVMGTADVTIYDDFIPVIPEPEDKVKKESLGLFEGENMLLFILLIVFLIIIILLVIMLLRSRGGERATAPPPPPPPSKSARARRDDEEIGPGAEFDEEEPEAIETEAEEVEEEKEVEEEGGGWEVIDDEDGLDEDFEDIDEEDLEDIDLEDEAEKEPVMKTKVPAKGKMPVRKTKVPAKGKMPVMGKMPKDKFEDDSDFELDDDVLKPDKSTARPLGVPQLMVAKDSVKCNICLGYIKPGLHEIHCKCGKHYHEQCADRVGLCPVCDTDLSEPVDLTDEEVD